MLFGVLVGAAGTFLLALGVINALDGRYTTRREYEATLKHIEQRLATLAGESAD